MFKLFCTQLCLLLSNIHIDDFNSFSSLQLLKDANSAVPMTANEKKRIEVLLQDLDVFFDHDQDIESNCSWNVSSMNCPLGDGFTSSNEDKALLNLIDSKLKSLMSGDEFNSVASTQRSTSTQGPYPASTSCTSSCALLNIFLYLSPFPWRSRSITSFPIIELFLLHTVVFLF
ncbi:unnamed protein product [Acanthosepion pharaonis]|uniref:Fibrous sheath-interacting protein 1 n=1 Tax=Acanthosepion pharaonis TaxID=158019 RepID=A0A812CSH0_ACAPH|nr:unnamed protein product [Sepia pharaonis]